MAMLFSIFFYFTFLSAKLSNAVDTLSPNGALRDNGETLVSARESFELGFFSPWNSSHRYIGIWFKNIPDQTVVWVANRDFPLNDSSGILTITTTGNVIIHKDGSGVPIWSSNSSANSSSSFLQLLDTGNMVVKDADSGSYFWQSFDHPCDTLIQGMKFGLNLRTNQSWYLSSWRSPQDPSTGDSTHQLQATGLPQFILRIGSNISYRSGPWDGVQFGSFKLLETRLYKPIFVSNSTFLYYSFENKDNSISRFVLNQTNLLQQLSWNERRGEWVATYTLQRDECDVYGKCGSNGICNTNKDRYCWCPRGFIPKIPQDWDSFDWSGGCTRRVELNCSEAAGFRKISRLKLPDNSHYFLRGSSMTRLECEVACLRNCSCVAYALIDENCFMWFGSLIDMREYTDGGQNLYVRVAASELESEKKVRRKTVIVIVSVFSFALLLVLISCYNTWKRGHKRRQVVHNPNQEYEPSAEEGDLDLPLFDMVSIKTATNDFAFTNKIGEGGFGHVYKGILPTGQEIAVKRLSKHSHQGLQEFKNEVILIAKLQHRNLVRLLGCCIHGEEKMLIYEYMHNRSLDLYNFNQTSEIALDWQKRFDIIVGIARGLLYLHRDSRLRIIHRDLKASNILLDGDMTPKISDFGLARIFGGDQTEANTTRVVGTYGYMSPEYAIDGLFSVKSDVFSFGVLVLELVSGKRNRGFRHSNHDKNLLGHAWKLWNEDKAIQLVDFLMEKSVTTSEVMRCIQVGLLCVQEHPDDRPTMPSVLLMLDCEQPSLPQPKQPGFYTGRFLAESILSSPNKMPHNTANEVTITMLQGR